MTAATIAAMTARPDPTPLIRRPAPGRDRSWAVEVTDEMAGRLVRNGRLAGTFFIDVDGCPDIEWDDDQAAAAFTAAARIATPDPGPCGACPDCQSDRQPCPIAGRPDIAYLHSLIRRATR